MATSAHTCFNWFYHVRLYFRYSVCNGCVKNFFYLHCCLHIRINPSRKAKKQAWIFTPVQKSTIPIWYKLSQSLSWQSTVTALIDCFTRWCAYAWYSVNQLIKFGLLTQSIMCALVTLRQPTRLSAWLNLTGYPCLSSHKNMSHIRYSYAEYMS